MTARHLADGASAERIARRLLERQGMKLVESNVSCRFGEIDLVMQDGDDWVFVEVRLRRNPGYGHPAESIGPGKRARLRRSASWYLQRHGCTDTRGCRFDVVAVGEGMHGEWIRDAFH